MGWGILGSIGSAISSGIGACCNAIGNAFSAASSAFSSAMTSLGSVFSTAGSILSSLSVVMPYIGTIAKVIDVVLGVLGLLEKDEKTEDIGDRVLQGYEIDIKPKDFATYEQYISAIREIKLDPEKSKNYNLGEKLAAGLTVQSWGMEEKYGQGSSDFLINIIKDAPNLAKGNGYFTESRVQNILDKIKDVAEVAKYFANKLNPDDSNRVEQQLVNAEQSFSPDKSLNTIYQELDKYKKD